MKQKLQYLYIEIKKTFRILPRMLLQAVLLLLLTGMIALGGVKSMEREPLTPGADIAVVVREDNMLTRMALNYVENMESVSRLCRFRQTTEEEGFRLLDKGEVAALILLPEQLVEGIMDGANPTVDIYFPKHAGLEAMLFRELTEAGEGMLRVAQAQIYGADDTAQAYDLTKQLSVMEAEIDSYNLAFALDRLALYDEETVAVFGSMNVMQFYLASGMVLFLLLAGMAMYPVLQREPSVFRRQLERQGTGKGWQCFCQWLCGVLCMGVLFGLLWAVMALAVKFFLLASEGMPDTAAGQLMADNAFWYPAGVKMGIAALIVMASTAFVYLLHSLAGSRTGGILLVFVCSVAMVYLSGGIVPSVFLPETMQKLGERMPTAYLIQAAGGILAGPGIAVGGEDVAALCFYTVVFVGVSYFVRGRDRA